MGSQTTTYCYYLFVIFYITCYPKKVNNAPLYQDEDERDNDIDVSGEDRMIPQKNQSYYEMDDMMLPSDRAGQMNEVYRWPKGKIPYSFAPGYTKRQMMDIHMTMSYIEEFTCISFRNRHKNDDNYLQIRNVKGKCSSFVGNIRKGAQLVALDPDSRRCGKPHFPGHVLHELVHAIGFFHEHARDDRDFYIDILYANLPKDDRTRKNYNRNADNKLLSNTFGVPYNYGSITHYSKRGGSINGKDTIVRKKKIPRGVPPPLDGVMGQRDQLSRGDVLMIQRMYQHECPGTFDEDDIPEEIPDLEEWMEDRRSNSESESEPDFPIDYVHDEPMETGNEVPQETTVAPLSTTTTRTRKTTTKKKLMTITTTTTTTRRPNLFNFLQAAIQNIVQSG